MIRAAVGDKVALLLESERWPRERMDAWVAQRLETLLHQARGAPFWRDRIPPGASLSDLPLLEKDDLRQSLSRMRPPGERVVRTAISTGSSGRPVTIERGGEAIGFAAAARLRQLSWWGLPPAELSVANVVTKVAPDAPPVRRVCADPPRFDVNAFRLDADGVARAHAAVVEGGGVALLGGVTSILEQWAAAYARSDRDPAQLGAELVIVGGDITAASQRQVIASAFGCDTAEMYGAVEAPMIATECAEGSLHVNEEVIHVEVLRPDGTPAGEGVLGEVVVTVLHNTELPLLRYRLGDAAAVLPGPCSCGRTLRRLDMRLGRLEEMMLHPNGSLMHSGCIRSALGHSLGEPLRAFHTVQVEPDRFVAYLDVGAPIPSEAAERVACELGRYMRAPVWVELVPDAERARAKSIGPKRASFSRRIPGP